MTRKKEVGWLVAAAGVAILALTLLADLTTIGLAEPAVAPIQLGALGMIGAGAAEAWGKK